MLRYKTDAGTIGKVADIPQIDPIVLEFADGARDAFYKDTLHLTDEALTIHADPRRGIPRDFKGRKPTEKTKRKISQTLLTKRAQRILLVRAYLKKQSKPIPIITIEKSLGFIARPMIQTRKKNTVSLEELGIVDFVLFRNRFYHWYLTEKGHNISDEELAKEFVNENKKRVDFS